MTIAIKKRRAFQQLRQNRTYYLLCDQEKKEKLLELEK